MATKRTEFVNRTQGLLGAVKINRKGDPLGIAVEPDEHVYLTDEEIELTEEAHKNPKDSPFVIREIIHREEGTGDESARFAAAPLSRVEKRSRPKAEAPA